VSIRLVTLDFWETIMADTPENLAAAHALRLSGVRAALGGLGYACEAGALAEADTRAVAALQAIWTENRDVEPAEQLRIFLTAIDPALASGLSAAHCDAVAAAYAAPVLTHGPVLSPGVLEAIRALADRGLALAIISNTGRTPGTMLRRLLDRAGVLAAFRVFSFSDEVGARKPAGEIFRRTLAAAGCEPAAAVHVGDNPEADVDGARAVGMHAIHYVPDGRPPSDRASAVLRRFPDLPGLVADLRRPPDERR
jgi:putative hydrolase of the HAD superfamily